MFFCSVQRGLGCIQGPRKSELGACAALLQAPDVPAALLAVPAARLQLATLLAILQELPEQLGLDAGKAQKVVTELAKDKKHTTLVQVSCCFTCWYYLYWSCVFCALVQPGAKDKKHTTLVQVGPHLQVFMLCMGVIRSWPSNGSAARAAAAPATACTVARQGAGHVTRRSSPTPRC